MKALGASGARVFAIYLTQVLLLALIGGAIGLALGATLPFADRRGPSARSFRCRSCRRCIRRELVLALVYGLLTALAFALWPLGRAHDVPVGAVPRRGRAGAALAAQALCRADGRSPCSRWPRSRSLLAYDRRVAIIFVAAPPACSSLLRLVAGAADVRRAPRAARALDRACAWRSPISTGRAR